MKNHKFNKLVRIERLRKLKIISLSLLFFAFFAGLSLLFFPLDSIKIEAKVVGTTYVSTDTGNIVKLKIETIKGGTGHVSLPTRTALKTNANVLVTQTKTFIGTTFYRFVRYIE